MQYSLKDNTLELLIEGRVDSSNADAVEKEIKDILSNNTFEKVVINADKLEYISSAGLRIVLRVKKEYPSLKLIGVSSDVYEIFEMTGFTEMMEIEKAYRTISVEGCEVIGQGANGKVYRINSDTIVKVYVNPDSLDDIRRERDLAKKAFVLGIPTAISYDIARVGEGYGTVFELLNAKSFVQLINSEPEKADYYIGLCVDLLKKIHSTIVKKGDMPNIKEKAIGWIDYLKGHLPENYWQKLSDMINAIPESDNMLHGDYHIKNVMMQNGEVLLIDMDTLCVGNPVFEFGGIYNTYEGFSHMEKVHGDFLGISSDMCDKIWKETLKKYFGTDDEKVLKEIENKAKVIGYTKILRRTLKRAKPNDEKSQEYVEFYRKALMDAIDSVSSLAI